MPVDPEPGPGSPDRTVFLCLKSQLSALQFELALIKYVLVLRLASYNPDQPRVPAGTPDGGQWTSEQDDDTGLVRVAENEADPHDPTRVISDVPSGTHLEKVVFKSWPAPPNLSALGVVTLELPFGDPKQGMIHILAGHSSMGPVSSGKSIFDDLVIGVFDGFLQAGLPLGVTQRQRTSIVIEVHAIVPVGTDISGKTTYDFRTIIAPDPGLGLGGYKVITSYPIPDGSAGKFIR